tara:strand:+ start:441 stop:641 length:201 start_codon:yes stop_codon:yes gene_type:complete
MNIDDIFYVSCVSGAFSLVIGMCICSLYRDNVYLPKVSYENGDTLREDVEIPDYDSNDDDEENRAN